MEKSALKELSAICKNQGFMKKGCSFFRLHGDGVLQTVKLDYEPSDRTYFLKIGMKSMYGHLEESYFTSFGCPAFFDAMCFLDPSYYQIKLEYPDTIISGVSSKPVLFLKDITQFEIAGFQDAVNQAMEEMAYRVKTETILNLFQSQVLPQMEEYKTQQAIITFYEQKNPTRKHYDCAYAFLAIGDLSGALDIVNAYVDQNEEAMGAKGIPQEKWIEDVWYYRTLQLKEMILSGNEAVTQYLNENYRKNMEMYEKTFKKRDGKQINH